MKKYIIVPVALAAIFSAPIFADTTTTTTPSAPVTAPSTPPAAVPNTPSTVAPTAPSTAVPSTPAPVAPAAPSMVTPSAPSTVVPQSEPAKVNPQTAPQSTPPAATMPPKSDNTPNMIKATLNLQQKENKLFAYVDVLQSQNLPGKLTISWIVPKTSKCTSSHYALPYHYKKYHTYAFRTFVLSANNICTGEWQVQVRNADNQVLAESKYVVSLEPQASAAALHHALPKAAPVNQAASKQPAAASLSQAITKPQASASAAIKQQAAVSVTQSNSGIKKS